MKGSLFSFEPIDLGCYRYKHKHIYLAINYNKKRSVHWKINPAQYNLNNSKFIACFSFRNSKQHAVGFPEK